MKEICLTKGYRALIDDEDFKELSQFKWSVLVTQTGYVYARAWISGKITTMHRYIMKAKDPKIKVDHKDHNTLNNQKSNLRVCSVSQNGMNRTKGFGESKYIGVSLYYSSKSAKIKYRAAIHIDKKQFIVGYYLDEIEAAKARDEAAKESYGEFATLNFT